MSMPKTFAKVAGPVALITLAAACSNPPKNEDNPMPAVITAAPVGQTIVDHCYDTSDPANAMRCVSWRNTKGSDTTTIWFGPYSSYDDAVRQHLAPVLV